jgi:hypothetical protein
MEEFYVAQTQNKHFNRLNPVRKLVASLIDLSARQNNECTD